MDHRGGDLVRESWLDEPTIDDWAHPPGGVALAAGRMINPNIQLERLIGRGGMGSVWVAHHRMLGTEVAVKFVAPDKSMCLAELHVRFLREAGAVSRIACANVVRTFDYGVTGEGTPYLVMELLEGESLAQRIDQGGPLQGAEAASVVSQCANALFEAHRMGIIHRDVKPANIFLTPSGADVIVKLIDFGIAKDMVAATNHTTKSGTILGTPQYMSPEILLSPRNADAHADLWALAVTAYELLTGSPPFLGANVPQVITSITCRDYAPPSRLARPPAVADLARLDAFFARAFSHDKAARFASVLDFARAFSEACGESKSQRAVFGRRLYGAQIPLPAPPVIESTPPPAWTFPSSPPTPLPAPAILPSLPPTIHGEPLRRDPRAANRSSKVWWGLLSTTALSVILAGVAFAVKLPAKTHVANLDRRIVPAALMAEVPQAAPIERKSAPPPAPAVAQREPLNLVAERSKSVQKSQPAAPPKQKAATKKVARPKPRPHKPASPVDLLKLARRVVVGSR